MQNYNLKICNRFICNNLLINLLYYNLLDLLYSRYLYYYILDNYF